MRAFLDGRFRQPDDDVLGQAAGRDIDLDLNGQGLDADEREGIEFSEHNQIPLALRKSGGARSTPQRPVSLLREGQREGWCPYQSY